MMLVETYVSESTIPGAGKGIFAANNIPEGQVLWEFTEDSDVFVPDGTLVNYLDTLSPSEEEDFWHFAYRDKWMNGWVLCGDHARYMNHSLQPNIVYLEDGTTVAGCDIAAGTELTTDYTDLGLPTNFAA